MTSRICSVDNCSNLVSSRGLCRKHYSRLRRTGTTELLPRKNRRPRKSRYISIRIDGHSMLEHRHIMEKHLGRPLLTEEFIHHVNGDGHDNRIENLMILSNSEHMHLYHPDNNHEGPPPEPIMEAMRERLGKPSMTFDKCFCGEPVHARNLCQGHYGAAKTFHLFTPHKKRGAWIRTSPATFRKIKERLGEPSSTYDTCFCDKPVLSRNLCNAHYQIAIRNNLHKTIKYKLRTRPKG